MPDKYFLHVAKSLALQTKVFIKIYVRACKCGKKALIGSLGDHIISYHVKMILHATLQEI